MKATPIKNIFYNYCTYFMEFLAVVFFVVSCDSFVEVDLPQSQLTSVSVFDSYTTANAALTNIYSKLRDQGILTGNPSGISNQLGHYTDELTAYGSPNDPARPFYTNALLASNTTVLDYWNAGYNQIYAANAVLEGSTASTRLTEKEKQSLKGESLFIRALVHFYLANLFGEIPYVITTDYKTNSSIKKSSMDKIYEKITTDLKQASVLLDKNYKNNLRVRPNKAAVVALLARAELYSGHYPEAAALASEVLGTADLYSLQTNIDLVFLKESKETIWQLQSSTAGKNTDEAGAFIFNAGPPPLSALNTAFVETFSVDDLRKNRWIKTISNGSNKWYHANKYKEFNNTVVSKEYSIVLRLAEQYFIRAEARVYQGDLSGAKDDLNKIRNRAGLGSTDAVTKEEIVNELLQERQRELFTEYGHRFFDLKRMGKIDIVLSASKPGWNSTDILLPLPENELSVNPNLRPQNSGY